MKLIATPNAFFAVIGSFKATAAMNIVAIGESVPMSEISTGVVHLHAKRKDTCVRKRPSIDATKTRGRSEIAIFSALGPGRMTDASQKRMLAPMARSVKSSSGEIKVLFEISLQITMLTPKMRYAEKQEICPASFDVSITKKDYNQPRKFSKNIVKFVRLRWQ